MLYGLANCTLLLVPGRRPSVCSTSQLRTFGLQPGHEGICEQAVIAVPTTSIVQCDDKQIASIEILKHALPIVTGSHGVARRRIEPIEDSSRKQKSTDRL